MTDPSTPPGARRPRSPRAASQDAPAQQGGGRWSAVLAIVRALVLGGGLLTAYYLLPLDETGTGATSMLLLGGLVAVLALFWWEMRLIMRSAHPRLRAVEALSATLILFLVLFAAGYYLLDRNTSGSFSEPLNRTDALYFALTTFTTVGYGDITARSQPGRIVTMVQMCGGLLVVGVAAKVLAGAVQTGLRRQRREQVRRARSRRGDATDR